MLQCKKSMARAKIGFSSAFRQEPVIPFVPAVADNADERRFAMIEDMPHRCAGGSVDRRSALRAMMGSVALAALAGLPGAANAHAQEGVAQEGWRRCRKCQIMFFAEDLDRGFGVCPAGGAHDPSSRDHYYLRRGPERAGVQQAGWSWCMKCTGLYARVRGNMGVCPARGPHDNFSGAYAVLLGDDRGGRQGGWLWCSKCMGMFYGRGGGGVCPRDGDAHDGRDSLSYAQLT